MDQQLVKLSPTPLVAYEDVASDHELFMATLQKFHSSMGSKFNVPLLGGKELDLHKLFVEVTSRGGISKIISDRKWKEVTGAFDFLSILNASFLLRMYYNSLLYHYEQLYFIKSHSRHAISTDAMNHLTQDSDHAMEQKGSVQHTEEQQIRVSSEEQGASLVGTIDGKFESGYLVTVTMGSEILKGVIYHGPQNPPGEVQQLHSVSSGRRSNARQKDSTRRRYRRKKYQMKGRDPAHPKPNRSGYTFFFAEQYQALKSVKSVDRDISKIIGERWNKLDELEKAVYQDMASKDKARYVSEMKGYKQKATQVKDPCTTNQQTEQCNESLLHEAEMEYSGAVSMS